MIKLPQTEKLPTTEIPQTVRRQIGRALWAGLVVGLMAEISISPFGTAFRFSLGPVALAFFALFFLAPVYLTGLAAGLMVPLVHAAFALTHDPSVPVLTAVAQYLPETVAYTGLGGFLYLFRVRSRTQAPLQAALLLAAADLGANVVELMVRAEMVQFRQLVMMALVAVGRASVALGAFYVLQAGVRERQWAEERRSYMERLIWTVNLQTEAFFLQKSSRDMEQIMAKAHRVYRELSGHPNQPLVLEIAKDIHEIKKDYQRTLASLYRLVEMPELQPEMDLSEVVALVVDANVGYGGAQGKAISFSTNLQANFRTPRYGRWVSILNNLVSNGVEACGSEGSICVATARVGSWLVLRVEDTGSGIPSEDRELIFSPGFSTKLNPVTGNFSSGIGLTHAAGLVASMGGTIKVERSDGSGTAFRVEVPWSGLETVDGKGGQGRNGTLSHPDR